MTELKPCPFCGGRAKKVVFGLERYKTIGCEKCGVLLPLYRTHKETIEAWNKRPNPWHTEPPTEEGDYVVLCSTDGEYMVCHLEANLEPEIFHRYFKAWYGQKIEPYKEEK